MRLVDYLDKGASLGPDAPCLTMDGKDLSYAHVQRLSYRIARGLAGAGIAACLACAALMASSLRCIS